MEEADAEDNEIVLKLFQFIALYNITTVFLLQTKKWY